LATVNESIPSLKTLVVRGARKKCPRCGQGELFRKWNTLHDSCAVCGLKYLESQGDLWGLIIFFDRALFIFPIIVMIYFRLYNASSGWFYGGGVAMLFLLIFTLPQRTGICLALDYALRRNSEQPPKP
jgi:uncharacterized protein (DUF983 family)